MAAGLGFKTFTTGEVLTAADTNGYLMQGVLVFASAAARDAAITSPQEGQCCYLKDTDAVLTYSGTAWVGFDDSNAIQNSLVDAKGDIVAASGNDTPARLAVGNNGETLVANSSTATGLAYREDYAAGKNKIINGDFRINQRGFTTTTGNEVYTFDRWATVDNTTVTYSAQTFTLGAAPVAGYEGINFARIATTTDSSAGEYALYQQKVEDVRTLAGQTLTVSFWAKASAGTPKVGVELFQVFGTGGSPSASTGAAGQSVTISTSWTRYSATIINPSISGKTLGTNNNSFTEVNFWITGGSSSNTRSGSVGNQSATIDIWGVQVEEGSVATAFNTATGTIQGELAACQRYYWRSSNTQTFARHGTGAFSSGTLGVVIVAHPVTMRIAPTSIDFSSLLLYDFNSDFGVTNLTLTTNCQSSIVSTVSATIASGGTQYRPIQLTNNNNASGYVGFSAEL